MILQKSNCHISPIGMTSMISFNAKRKLIDDLEATLEQADEVKSVERADESKSVEKAYESRSVPELVDELEAAVEAADDLVTAPMDEYGG